MTDPTRIPNPVGWIALYHDNGKVAGYCTEAVLEMLRTQAEGRPALMIVRYDEMQRKVLEFVDVGLTQP